MRSSGRLNAKRLTSLPSGSYNSMEEVIGYRARAVLCQTLKRAGGVRASVGRPFAMPARQVRIPSISSLLWSICCRNVSRWVSTSLA